MDATRLGITFQEAQAVLRNIRNRRNEGCDTRLPRENVHETKRGLYYCMPSVVFLTKKCLTNTIEISTFAEQNTKCSYSKSPYFTVPYTFLKSESSKSNVNCVKRESSTQIQNSYGATVLKKERKVSSQRNGKVELP